MVMDDIVRAVLAREEVARYIGSVHGKIQLDVKQRIQAYLDELCTTQRYPLYRALQHPLYPILRKIDRLQEHVEIARAATRNGRVIYASNHKSHTDYLVEPLVLDDNGVRPPVIAAGINLFGGPLGLIHRYVTGAIPIRRNTKDPAYLITLKAYIAEVLQRHDLLLYLEGGRSYSGALKPLKTGLLHAALLAQRSDLVIVPIALAYDLVLEDHVLAKQGVKRRQRRFTYEIAEMVRDAVGYQSRAFVTFGQPIPTAHCDPGSRLDIMRLSHQIRDAIGRLYKVLPTAVIAAAIRPSITSSAPKTRIDDLLDTLRLVNANLDVTSGQQVIEQAAAPLVARGVIVVEGGRYRVRDRIVLRYYARTIQHLLTSSSNTIRLH